MDENVKVPNLQPIILKLNHDLEEIRIRALNSLLSKLNSGVICEADLVQERQLHIALLNWFNVHPVTRHKDVLSLISRLSQKAGPSFVSIGAIDFLESLRKDITVDFHSIIDSILNQLFFFPTSNQNENNVLNHLVYDATLSIKPSESFEPNVKKISNGSHYDQQADATQYPFFDKYLSTSIKCFNFSMFPWVPLLQTDKHVLLSMEKSLRNSDDENLLSIFTFLSDVVFRDFPAEVFLQRTQIVKSLLMYVTPENIDFHTQVSCRCVATLTDLVSAVITRVQYHMDPEFVTSSIFDLLSSYDPASNVTSSSSSSSHNLVTVETRRRGDGKARDVDDSASSSVNIINVHAAEGEYLMRNMNMAEIIEQLEPSEFNSLQFNQLSTAQFAILLLERLVVCLKHPDMEFLSQSLRLFDELINLLAFSINLSHICQEKSLPAIEFITRLQDILENLCDIILFYHHSNFPTFNIQSNTVIRSSTNTASYSLLRFTKHRQMFIGLSMRYIRLIQSVLPPDQIPKEILKISTPLFSLISLDRSLLSIIDQHCIETVYNCLGFPELRFNEIIERCMQVDETFKMAALFIRQSDHCKKNINDFFGMGLDSVQWLVLHKSTEYIQLFVNIIFQIYRENNRENYENVNLFLEKILSLKDDMVQQILLESILNQIKNQDGTVQNIFVDSNLIMLFLLNGLIYSSNIKIKSMTDQLIISIFESIELTDENLIKQAFAPNISLLQCYCEIQTEIYECVKKISNSLSEFERLQWNARLCFHTDKNTRNETAKYIYDYSLNNNLLNLSNEINQLNDLFIITHQESIFQTKKIYKEEDVINVNKILSSTSLTMEIKISAMKQLIIYFEDNQMVDIFVEIGGLTKIIDLLSYDKLQNYEDNKMMLPILLKCLKLILFSSNQVLHILSQDQNVFNQLIQIGLQFKDYKDIKTDFVILFAMLAFFDIIKIIKSPESPENIQDLLLNKFLYPLKLTSKKKKVPTATLR